MTNLADYIVLNDDPIRLSVLLQPPNTPAPQSKYFRFHLPDDFTVGARLAKPVLMFRCTALDDTRVHVHVNPESTSGTSSGFPTASDYSWNLPKGHVGLHMETIHGGRFKKGQENVIVIRIAGDSLAHWGDLIIGDAVLLIQREITLS